MKSIPQQYVLDQDFGRKQLDPALGSENPEFKQTKSGRQYTGRISFPIQLPFARYRSVYLAFDVTFKTSGAISLNAGNIATALGGDQNPDSCIIENGGFGAHRLSETFKLNKRQHLEYKISPGEAEILIDGRVFLSWKDERVPGCFTGLLLRLWGDPLIHRLYVQADKAASATVKTAASSRPFQFQVTIDFVDDLMNGIPYGQGHFESMLDHFKAWGVKRIYWIYYEHAGDRGFYEDSARSWDREFPGYGKAVRETFAQCDPLDYLIRRAHERGLEIYGLFKPYEMGYSFMDVYLPNSPEGREFGRVRMVDGWMPILPEFFRSRHEMLTCRKPGTSQEELRSQRIYAIKLFHLADDAIGLTSRDIILWTSSDNNGYQPYLRKFRVTETSETRSKPVYDFRGTHYDGPPEKVRVLTISGIKLESDYIALSISPRNKKGKLSNRLYALAELLDENGNRIPFTYGLAGNPVTKPFSPENLPRGSIHYDSTNSTQIFSLNATPDGIESFFAFGGADRFLAFAKGKNQRLGAPEAAYPEVRGFWMDCVRDLIRRGVDGMDFRVRNHTNTFEWSQFGYNKPIADEFRRRFGRDILKENFDLASWRKLRGEYYTAFLREASSALHATGKKCQVHLGLGQAAAPYCRSTLMNMHWDWRQWIEQGYADEISNKGIDAEGAFWEEVRSKAAARRIPIYCTPSCGSINFRFRGWQAEFRRMFDYARESGQSGFNLYEYCELLRPRAGTPALEVLPAGKGFTEFMRSYNRGER